MAKPGERYGRWVVMREAARHDGKRCWVCRCDCGASGEVRESNLTYGQSTSCGCARREAVSFAVFKHGHTWKDGVEHHTPEYLAWSDMKKRCYSPVVDSYPLYGGKKITVCDRWRDSFEVFLADVGPRPAGTMLRRLNKKKGYEPGNVVWDTRKKTQLKKIDQRLVTIGGVTKQLIEWADEYKIKKNTLHWRLEHWPERRWLEKPAYRGRRSAG